MSDGYDAHVPDTELSNFILAVAVECADRLYSSFVALCLGAVAVVVPNCRSCLFFDMPPSFPLLELPEEVLSNVLGTWLDGKGISTFLTVIQCTKDCDSEHVLCLARNALVHRYGQLKAKLSQFEEISDALMVMREDIRTSEDTVKFPEHCSIMDYFESQMKSYQMDGWVIWSGPIETAFGVFQAQLRCKTEWTLGALQYWYHDIELQQFAIVHPFSPTVSDQQYDPNTFYGSLEGLNGEGTMLLKRLYQTLEHDPEHWQRYLVLRCRSYDEEPSEYFTPITGDDTGLFCYWDSSEQTYDWEEALDKLGDNVIRIMSRCVQQKGSFP